MNFTAFFSYIVLAAFTPGPNNVMSMTNASKYGFKKAFPFNMGVLFGMLGTMTVCAIFTSSLYNFIPAIKPFMLCIGACYILWLAWSVWRVKPQHEKEEKKLLATNSVFTGMVLQFINVKLILYGITAFSSFILPHYNNVMILVGFVILLSFVGFSGTCCWSFFGAAFERFFKQCAKVINTVMALLLVYCAATMFWDLWKIT